MIGKLRGFIDSIFDDKCIVDVNGVGYVVNISNKTAGFLSRYDDNTGQEKKQVSLTIETVVKEDSIELFGFVSEIERVWFLEVNKVQGVGAKMGLKIMAHFTIEELIQSLIAQDSKAFCAVSGIGPKLAQRIITELKDRPKKLGMDNMIDVEFIKSSSKISGTSSSRVSNDALSALENLGYKKAEATNVVKAIIKENPDIDLELLITNSLQQLSR